MKYKVDFTYAVRFTGQDGRSPSRMDFPFTGNFSGQMLPRVGDVFYLDVREKNSGEYCIVESIGHRPENGIVHSVVVLETDEAVDPGTPSRNIDSEREWVRDHLIPLMKAQGFVPKQ
jgi:hypothetical protein